MLRRIATVFALATLLAPAASLAREWEEDYTSDDQGEAPPPPSDEDYPVSVDEAPPVTIDSFETSLSPYGDWVVAGSYGRVWRPHVAAGWRPYFYGRWEWTHEGWLWVSDEPFGWAAYHYGRWALDPGYGWVWVPGYEWAPAWVSWRYSGDVVGWAPLGPGVSVYVSATPFADAWWTFVPCHRFVAEPVYRVAYQPAFTRRYFFETQPAPARPIGRPGMGRPAMAPAWGGPPPRAIEQRIGRPISPVRVIAAPSPGPGRAGPGEVSIFRPGFRAGSPAARPAPAPGRFEGPGRSVGAGRVETPGRFESPSRPEPPGRGSAFRPSAPRIQQPPPAAAPAPAQPRRDRGGAFVPHGWHGSPGGPGAQSAQGARPERSFAPPSGAPRESARPQSFEARGEPRERPHR